jgi:hypothetical protein
LATALAELFWPKFVAEVPRSAIFDGGSDTSLVFAIENLENAM